MFAKVCTQVFQPYFKHQNGGAVSLMEIIFRSDHADFSHGGCFMYNARSQKRRIVRDTALIKLQIGLDNKLREAAGHQADKVH